MVGREGSRVPPRGHCPGGVSAWQGSTPRGQPPHRLSQPAGLSRILPGEQEQSTPPSPRRDARPTRLIASIPAVGCVSVLIKDSLTLSKPCAAGSVALRERDSCQRVSREKRGRSIQLAAETGGQPGATVHWGLRAPAPAGAAGGVPRPGVEQGPCFRASFLVRREVYNGNKSDARSKCSSSRPVSSGAACGDATGACLHATAGARGGEVCRGWWGSRVFWASPCCTALTESSRATGNTARLQWHSQVGRGVLPFPWGQ